MERLLLAFQPGRQLREKTGQQEFEERTQIVERVLQRRAGEQETPASPQRAERLRGLRAAVLQVLCLVGEDEVEPDRLEQRAVARERAVGGEHEVVRREVLRRQPALAVMDEHAQPRREPGALAPPVLQQRCRHDDQRRVGRGLRSAPGLAPVGRWRAFPRHRGQQRQRLRRFAEAHFVGEDAPELFAIKVPEPRDAEALVGTQRRREPVRHGRRRERGQVAQRRAAPPPRLGGGEMRRDRLEQVGHLGRARACDPVTSLRACGGRRRLREGAVRGLELAHARGVEQVDAVAVLEVTAAGRQRGAHLRVARRAGAEAERDLERVARLGDLRGDLGRLQFGGVAREVFRELRAEALAQRRAVRGEEVEDLVPVAQPPLARERIEREAVLAHEFQRRLVQRRLARRQRDREVVLRAVDGQRRVVALTGGGRRDARCGLRRRRRRRGGGGLFDQVLAHAGEGEAVPRQRVARAVDAVKDLFACERREQLAQLRAGELHEHDRGRLHAVALQHRESRHQLRRRRGGEVELQPQRDRVARRGAGEVGWEQDAKHEAATRPETRLRKKEKPAGRKCNLLGYTLPGRRERNGLIRKCRAGSPNPAVVRACYRLSRIYPVRGGVGRPRPTIDPAHG